MNRYSTHYCIYVTGFDKSQLPHTQLQGWLFTTTWLISTYIYINELTIHECIITNGFLVCFSWGLFLGCVWSAWVLKWSSNGSDLTGQASTQLEISKQLARELGYQISYYLWYLELKQASNETIWQCSTSTHGKICHFVAPNHPWPPPLCNYLWYWCKNYLKWWAIQLAVLCRVGQYLRISWKWHTSSSLPSQDMYIVF